MNARKEELNLKHYESVEELQEEIQMLVKEL